MHNVPAVFFPLACRGRAVNYKLTEIITSTEGTSLDIAVGVNIDAVAMTASHHIVGNSAGLCTAPSWLHRKLQAKKLAKPYAVFVKNTNVSGLGHTRLNIPCGSPTKHSSLEWSSGKAPSKDGAWMVKPWPDLAGRQQLWSGAGHAHDVDTEHLMHVP